METLEELKLRTKVIIGKERYHWRDGAQRPFCNYKEFDVETANVTMLKDVPKGMLLCPRCNTIAAEIEKGW